MVVDENMVDGGMSPDEPTSGCGNIQVSYSLSEDTSMSGNMTEETTVKYKYVDADVEQVSSLLRDLSGRFSEVVVSLRLKE